MNEDERINKKKPTTKYGTNDVERQKKGGKKIENEE